MIQRLVLISLALFIAGCQSPTVRVTYDQTFAFDRVATFAWHPNGNTLRGVWPQNQTRAAELLQNTIETQLNRNQLGRASQNSQPGVWVAYHLGVKHRREVEKWGYVDQFGSKRPIPVEAQVYREGTLFVDLINPDSGLIIWRGMATGTVEENAPRETIKQRVMVAIERMFFRFPDG